MRFLHPERDERLELALEDVFLLPARFEGGSRLAVDLGPPDFPPDPPGQRHGRRRIT